MPTRQHLTINSSPGNKLASVLSLPANCVSGCVDRTEPVPGVVLCHGPGGYGMVGLMERDALMTRVEDSLAEAGYASLRFYYRGVGDSEGPLYRLIPMEQVEDIREAITFLQSRPEVDPERIGLLGFATGGSHATYVAAIDERVKCMVSVNGVGDWGRWLQSMRTEEEWRLFLDRARRASENKASTGEIETVELREIIKSDAEKRRESSRGEAMPQLTGNLVSLDSVLEMLPYRAQDYSSKISPRASMWIGAAGDLMVPNLESESMYRNAGEPKRLELLEGETHSSLYRETGFEKLMRLAREWFDRYL